MEATPNYQEGMYVNYILGALFNKIIIPTEFHEQVRAVKDMQIDDVSGLVDSLTDFSVNSADVQFSIETDNTEFTKILKQWLDTINLEYNGKIPIGISALAQEYFKERWKYSSFPVLKIGEWGTINGVLVPIKMFFVDGGSINAEEKDKKSKKVSLLGYDYSLGKDAKLDKNVIIRKPYSRWYDKYPTPYLIKRGIYHNWKIVQSLKDKQSTLLNQIIPYMMAVKKGDASLVNQGIKKGYSDPELKKIAEQLQKLMDDLKLDSSAVIDKKKTPIRVTNFDEVIEHIIPKLVDMFDNKLFQVAERNILSGLGFIEMVSGISASRRESALNPKAFIEEVKKGVKDFKSILNDLILIIKDKNKRHKKYINSDFYIASSPVRGFMTDNFKQQVQRLWRAGRLSDQTAIELVAEVDFETEVYRKKKEAKDGLESIMYPPVADNREGVGIDLKEELDKNGKEIPVDKTDDIEKKEFDMGELEGAPYKTIRELPKQVKNAMGSDLQGTWMRVFNKALNTYGDETRAFRVAWSVIRQIARKGKDGKWHRKRKRVKGKLEPVKVTKSVLLKALKKEEEKVIDETLESTKKENTELQNRLLKKLVKEKNKKDN